jgi:hypothetical protein
VILIFRDVRRDRELRTLVTGKLRAQHREKIVVVMSTSEEVIAFNYVQTKSTDHNSDITAELEFPDKGVDQVFKVEPQQKPQQP